MQALRETDLAQIHSVVTKINSDRIAGQAESVLIWILLDAVHLNATIRVYKHGAIRLEIFHDNTLVGVHQIHNAGIRGASLCDRGHTRDVDHIESSSTQL